MRIKGKPRRHTSLVLARKIHSYSTNIDPEIVDVCKVDWIYEFIEHLRLTKKNLTIEHLIGDIERLIEICILTCYNEQSTCKKSFAWGRKPAEL